MKALQDFLKAKIISNENDQIGLIFFNTKTFKNKLNFQGIYVHSDLEVPSAQMVKDIPLIEKDFEKTIGTSSPKEHPLFEALWICNHELKDKKDMSTRIFLFSNNDNPNANNRNDRD